MELRVLRYFLAVARTGTLTAAAAQLNVTQPALSRQLKLLETELGVQLINREHKPVTLTPEGIYLVKQAEDMIAIADKPLPIYNPRKRLPALSRLVLLKQ
ncbi:LysR family transcriptional regulator [Weissella cibaria]|uniref:LysR family transcriptional regulator n=1 Tax=Weissella cibaria TaxID=137591 RepID=UPI001FAA8171|nr:LysR family transcriptional regulator [Weissella cibaria]